MLQGVVGPSNSRMPHYIDEYAPGFGRWQAASGRRYNLVIIDPKLASLPSGISPVSATTEEQAAAFFRLVPFRAPARPRGRPRNTTKQPKGSLTERALTSLLENYVKVESLNIGTTAAVQLNRWAEAGNEKARESLEWVAAHWAEYRAKQAAIAAGGSASLTPSSRWKPHRFEDIAAEMTTR